MEAVAEMLGERILHRTKKPLHNPKGSEADLGEYDDPEYLPATHDNATLVTSLLPNGNHMPVIDIDRECMLIETTTTGHFHLYINREMTRAQYFSMLNALVLAGVVEPGYYAHALRRGATFARYPGVTKHNEGERILETADASAVEDDDLD
jgi:hypothetical protein